MKTFPITVKLSKRSRNEWMAKEEGSFEDKGKPELHIYAMLRDNFKAGKLLIFTDIQRGIVINSANYQTSWDEGESKIVDNLIKECLRICIELSFLKVPE